MNEACGWTAREAVHRLRSGAVSPSELVTAALERIAEVEPAVNAVPTICADRAYARARAIEAGALAAPSDGRGWLAGLPVVIKDLHEVEGVRTTHGSPIYRDHVPTRSGHAVERLEAMGAVIIGKSNTPEFGAGAQTFNEVLGVTRNPWDTRLTCAGSSGGSAVALATGEAWLADGSDLGGSLRTPAAFCRVVGLRPSPGRVAHGPTSDPFGTLSVTGPMARDVADVALMLDAMAGQDPRDPLSWPAPARAFAELSPRPPAGRPWRIAYSADLGGITPVDTEVRAVCDAAMARLAGAGIEVVEAAPDLGHATEVFTVLRAFAFATSHAGHLAQHRRLLKPEIIWNIELGLGLGAERIGWALRERGLMQQRLAQWLEDYDALCCPAAIVRPFPVEQRYLEQLSGHAFASYIDWVAITYALTLTGAPVLALPGGFTDDGLPVGLQLAGRARGEAELLALGAAVEQRLGIDSSPIEPRLRHRSHG